MVSLLFFNFIPEINNYFSEISGQAKKGRRKKESRKNLFGSKMLELVLNFAAYESEDVAFEGRLAHFGDVASSGNNGNETFKIKRIRVFLTYGFGRRNECSSQRSN